ncbi:MAG: DHH family phosphoesterase [Patescibacteria group bacterium]
MTKYPWFKAKKYGLGWYPASWQGWLVLLLYLAMVVPLFIAVDSHSHSNSDTLINFSLPFIGLTSLLLALCYVTGEPVGWRWGNLNGSAFAKTTATASEASDEVKKLAPVILVEIKKAKHILLHLHPSPDPDSVGSALAMKFALEQLGKKVTAIRGDSEIPKAFMHFPGATEIVQKNFFEVDLKDFDLFIAQDSGSIEMISRVGTAVFPDSLKVIVIDHHRTNTKYGSINLVDSSYPATAQILFDLFKKWNISLTKEIASNLFMGMYTDTGGFKYVGTSPATFSAASELVKHVPEFSRLIAAMENSSTPGELAFQGLALNSIETFLNGKLALSVVSSVVLNEKGITDEDINGSMISTIMRRVGAWNVVGAMAEKEPGVTKVSFRSADGNVYDVSKLAVALGGGGHKAAAGVNMQMPISEAKKAVVAKAKEIYNL